jgi:predicted DNA-binding transcriptional regulator AlpA
MSLIPSDCTVLRLAAVAKTAGISLATLRREIERGRGPKVIRISCRRIGVRLSDLRQWLEERRAAACPPAEYAIEAGYSVLTCCFDKAWASPTMPEEWLGPKSILDPASLRRGRDETPCPRVRPVSASRDVEVIDFARLCRCVAFAEWWGNR